MKKHLTVIKIGGSLLEQGNFEPLVRGLVPYLKKHKSVIVHGGGKEVTALADQLGHRSRFVKGRRFTDEKMMHIVEMALSGKVNPYLVGKLNALKIPALGLSGRDRDLVRAKAVSSLGRVGTPTKVKADAILKMISSGDVPVFSSIASDGKGNALNVNADEMASAMAAALRAHRLILFTDVPGIMDQNKKTIPRLSPALGKSLIKSGVILGGMIPKINSALDALTKGVREIWILHGTLPLRKSRGTLVSHHALSRHPFS